MYALRIDSTEAAFNLALEETLFDTLSPENPGIFLIWRNAPSVIVGCHQNTAEEVDAAYCREHGIAVVRRPTGGGAVYHDLGNVNFSFLTWVEKNRLAGFEEFMRPMVQALRDLGVDASYTSRNDITVDGRKVAGTAQRRKGQKMLHHGCLMVDVDTSVLAGALAADPEKFQSKGVASHRARVANLKEFLPAGLSREECMNMVVNAMAARCAQEERTLAPGLAAKAEALADARYRSWDWNWGHSPRFTEKRRRRFSWGRLECLLEVNEGRITGCRLFGDFFAAGDITELEKLFIGLRSDAPSLRAALENVPVETWFSGAEHDELVNFLCGE
ncbi:lipoate--protein ligase [Mailhella massiliensis]|uniref:lipoate--protein ligase n=1 Tax=Mailhella massiliensis TaxID=1903261 RepID=UPI0023531300|nr:lipoate--protein ligase [Mailhella massiliensis]